MAMNNGHSTVAEEPVDGASVASSEDYNNVPPSPSSLANEQGLTANGMLASTRPKEPTDRFGFTGGKQFTKDSDWNTPVQVIRRREIKWLDMLDDWDKWMNKKPKKVRERCRKGIPCSIRSRAWQYLCGSKKLCEQNQARWQEFDTMEGDPKWIEVIQKDLDRQFPFHEMFASREGHGQQDLYRILKAYSIYNPRDGYCQAQAPVAAVLLMHMPAEDAFWALVQICEKYLTGYYSIGLEAVQIDGMVLAGLMKKESPTTHKHMKKHKIDPILYMTEWFMCVFSRALPWPSVLRVWDMFFCEGVKVLFRVALVLLKSTLGRSDQLRECQGLYETMEALRNIPASITNEDFLAAEMLKLRVFEKDMEEEHSLSLARRRVIKERQLAPEKAAAMARDIDILRKKKRGKVKPPLSKERKEGFGSQDVLAKQPKADVSVNAHQQDQHIWHQAERHSGPRAERHSGPEAERHSGPEAERHSGPEAARTAHAQSPEAERHSGPEADRHSGPEAARTAHAQSPVSHPSEGHAGEMVREVHVDNPPKDLDVNRTETTANPTIQGKENPKPPKSKDSKKEEKKKDKADKKKKGKSPHPKAEVMSVPHAESSTRDKDKGKMEKKDKDKKSKSKEQKKDEKKAKKAEKTYKKPVHSSSQPSSPVEDLGHHVEASKKLSNGNDNEERKSIEMDKATGIQPSPPEPREFRLSPYAEVFYPSTNLAPGDVVTGDHKHFSDSQPSSPVIEQEHCPVAPTQASQHHDHHDDQTSQLSLGLETPV